MFPVNKLTRVRKFREEIRARHPTNQSKNKSADKKIINDTDDTRSALRSSQPRYVSPLQAESKLTGVELKVDRDIVLAVSSKGDLIIRRARVHIIFIGIV